MDDRALVTAMVAGDPQGMEGAYRRYADRLHAYCRSLLKDADAASDAVHDTFLIASQRAGDLRDPDRLQAWLYTIARRECLRLLRASKRGAPLPEEEPAAEPVDLTRAIQAEQVRELVESAVAGLNDGDREVIQLAVRHQLSAAEVATVLGISAKHAHARMSRARAQLHRALGALLLARSGGRRCAKLAELTRGWNGAFTPLLRKRVSRHVETCSRCSESQQELLNPAQLLPAYAALPFLPVPALLWSRLEASQAGISSGSATAGAGPSAAEPSGADPSGSADAAAGAVPPTLTMPAAPPGPLPTSPVYAPPPGHQPAMAARDRRLPVVAAAAALALLVLVLGAGGLWLAGAFDPAPAAAPHIPDPQVGAGGSPASPTPTVTGPTAAPTASPTPPPTTPPPTTAGPTTAPPPAALAVTADGGPPGGTCSGSVYRIEATAQANKAIETALLYWKPDALTTRRVAMTLTGPRTAEGSTEPIILFNTTWWVEVRTAGGERAESEPVTVECN